MVVFTGDGEGAEESDRSTRTAEGELESVWKAEKVSVVVPDPENVVLSKTLDRILPEGFGAEDFTERFGALLVGRGGFLVLVLKTSGCLLEGWTVLRGIEVFWRRLCFERKALERGIGTPFFLMILGGEPRIDLEEVEEGTRLGARCSGTKVCSGE